MIGSQSQGRCLGLLLSGLTVLSACDATPEQLLEDFTAGPGQPEPQIVGVSGDDVLYLQPPRELQLSDWVPAPVVNLYSGDLRQGHSDMLATLLPASARFTTHSNGQLATWIDRTNPTDRVVVLNLTNFQRQDVYVAASQDDYIRRAQITHNAVLFLIGNAQSCRLIHHDLVSGEDNVLYETPEKIFDFAVRGDLLALIVGAHVEFPIDEGVRIELVDLTSGETRTIAQQLLLANGPFIDGDWVVYSGATILADNLGPTNLVVQAYNLETAQSNQVLSLLEGPIQLIEDIVKGKAIPKMMLRGALDGTAVISETIDRGTHLNEKISLYELESGLFDRQIGDFRVDTNYFWNDPIHAQVQVFVDHVAWYNPDDNRIVVFSEAGKRKIKPSEG